MKLDYLLISSLLLFLGGSELPKKFNIDQTFLSGNVSIRLKHGVWKLWEEKPVFQDITLDLSCEQGQCEQEVWGYAPKFNQEVDHDGKVEVIKSDHTWRLQVKMNIKFHPWEATRKEANYQIELVPYQNQLIGSYTGRLNDRQLSGQATGTISPHYPKKIANHQPITPREHPRLIFRAAELAELRKKAKTDYGQAILARLNTALKGKIYYDGYVPNGGYHAAGHCFLSWLNDDPKAAQTAWEIVEKSLANPGRRLLEHSPIVAGVALAYDFCYPAWDEEKQQKITKWLTAQTINLVNGSSPQKGWNANPWSNWSARARGAAGLAALAIMYEPEGFFPKNKHFSQPNDLWRLFKTAERNVQRYLTIAIGDHGLGTEGDHYTTEPLVLTILPFLQATQNVLGEDLVSDSSAEWLLPHYLMRMIGENGQISAPTYGRHRSAAGGSLFVTGLGTVPEKFLPGVFWFFNRHFALAGDRTFGIGTHIPIEAAFALKGYRNHLAEKNPTEIFGRVLEDKQKGFYVFRNQWQNREDFVASIYLKRQPLGGSWSFPDAGSFRIWGLGGKWASPGPSIGDRENENVVVAGKLGTRSSDLVLFESWQNGSGVVSLRDKNWLRSFAVDYTGASGVPGLFVVADQFIDDSSEKTWIMHTEEKVTIQGQSFTLQANNGATMGGTFLTPMGVKISFQPEEKGGKIVAIGKDQFFVVMTVQKGLVPKLKITGTGLDTQVKVGEQNISFSQERIILAK